MKKYCDDDYYFELLEEVYSSLPRVTLQDAWMRASENERIALLILLRRNYPEIMPQSEPYPPPQPPFKAPLIEHPPTTISDEKQDDSEVADWWIELQTSIATQGER